MIREANTAVDPTMIPRVSQAVTALPAARKPNVFKMSHLSATAFRGWEYQLLVLLAQLTKDLSTCKDGVMSFEAAVEIVGYGNLDDARITYCRHKKVVQVRAYQVKYYYHTIEPQHFVNESSEDTDRACGKTEKMHIGKFFNGWLSGRRDHPELDPEHLTSIIFTNASLSPVLAGCVDSDDRNGRLKSSFIDQSITTTVRRKTKTRVLLYQNFLSKWDIVQGSKSQSKKIWEELKEKGYIGEDRSFSDELINNIDDLDLNIDLSVLPDGVTKAMLSAHLRTLFYAEATEPVDFYELLYNEAWGYLKAKKYHPGEVAKTDLVKQNLFKEFLRSLHFYTKQPPIEAIIEKIIRNLGVIASINEDPYMTFLCLYYAISEWFCREYKDQSAPIITNHVLTQLIADARTRSQDAMRFRGRTEAALSHIVSGRVSIVRAKEEAELASAIEARGLVLVTGEKGMGKSSLVKQTLQRFDQAEFLVIPASDLVHDFALSDQLVKVLAKVGSFRIVVLDGAEVLLSQPAQKIEQLLAMLKAGDRSVILTLTPEGAQFGAFAHHDHIVKARLLDEQLILNHFPQLRVYERNRPIMDLLRVPFYLGSVTRLLATVEMRSLNFVFNKGDLEARGTIVKLVVSGQKPDKVKERRLAWQQLSLQISNSYLGHERGVELPSCSGGMKLLIEDRIVMREGKRYWFSHDLFFEHGLMLYWRSKWELASIEQDTASFWKERAKTLKTSVAPIFQRWVMLSMSYLKTDLIECLNSISQSSIFEWFIAIAIMNQDKPLLECFLEHTRVENRALPNIMGHFSTTYILLALWYKSEDCLPILIEHGVSLHHPEAGNLVLLENSAYYYFPSKTVVTVDEEAQNSSRSSGNEEEHDDSEEESKSSHSSDSSDKSEGSDEYEWVEEDPNDLQEKFIRSPNKYWSENFFQSTHSELYYEDAKATSVTAFSPPSYSTLYLHQAILCDRIQALGFLLSEYTKLNQPQMVCCINGCEETPLHLAALKGKQNAAELLLARGASLHLKDKWGETPLHNACYAADPTMVLLLLRSGADPNAANEMGLTPLHIAIAKLDLTTVKELLKHGADLSFPAFNGRSDVMPIADLINSMWENANKEEKLEIEEFVLELIESLNFGWSGDNLQWGTCCKDLPPELVKKQLDQVEELMTLVDTRAQLCEDSPGFDYTDEETELQYALEQGDIERIFDLTGYILGDPDNIAEVLEADSVIASSLTSELLNHWLETANQAQYENIECFAKDCEDENVLKIIREYAGETASVESDIIDEEKTDLSTKVARGKKNAEEEVAEMLHAYHISRNSTGQSALASQSMRSATVIVKKK